MDRLEKEHTIGIGLESTAPAVVEHSIQRRSDAAAKRLRFGLAALFFATGLAAVEISGAGGAHRWDPGIVIESGDALEAELMRAPKGYLMRLKAPETSAASDAASAKRTEAARRRVATISPLPDEVSTIIVPYTGGALPPEATDPPPDTIVLLEYVADASAKHPQLAPDPDIAVGAMQPSPEIVVEFAGGALPQEALSPPPGTIVRLLAPVGAPVAETGESASQAGGPNDAGQGSIDVPYSEALDAQELAATSVEVVRLEVPADAIAGELAGAVAPRSDSLVANGEQELVVPYREAKAYARGRRAPPAGTVIRLVAP